MLGIYSLKTETNINKVIKISSNKKVLLADIGNWIVSNSLSSSLNNKEIDVHIEDVFWAYNNLLLKEDGSAIFKLMKLYE